MEDGVSERRYSPVLLGKCGWLLKELEVKMNWSATSDSWTETTRSKWIANVNTAVTNKSLVGLYNMAGDLEKVMKYATQCDEWKNWKRDYWRAMYMGDSKGGVDTPVSVSQFANCVIDLEKSLLYSAQQSSWKQSGRSAWLEVAKSLMVPVENVLFAIDVLDQIEKCISNTSVYQWGKNIDRACSKLYKCAGVLDKVSKDTGIAKATGGGAAIGGGLLALGGLIAAPFTAGASLTATAAGTALALGGGITSFTASMVQHGWDKSQTKEGEEVTKTVCKQAQILSECLTYYCNTMTMFYEYLATPEGKQLIAELKTIDRDHSKSVDRVHSNVTLITLQSGSKAISLGLGGMKVKQAVSLMKVVAILRPGFASQLGAKLATQAAAGGIPRISVRGITLFTGVAAGSLAAKALSGVGAVLGVGFGIWDVVSASDQLKNGSEIASQFRELASNLSSTKKTICDNYKSLVEND